MAKINLNLTARVENVREPQRTIMPVHFEFAEIKGHFDESLAEIENLETIAFNRTPSSGFDIAYQTTKIMYAAYVSAEEGRRVNF